MYPAINSMAANTTMSASRCTISMKSQKFTRASRLQDFLGLIQRAMEYVSSCSSAQGNPACEVNAGRADLTPEQLVTNMGHRGPRHTSRYTPAVLEMIEPLMRTASVTRAPSCH